MIRLPASLSLNCNSCGREFGVSSMNINDLVTISCPFCRSDAEVVELLPVNIRLQVYREIREMLETAALDRLNKTDKTSG